MGASTVYDVRVKYSMDDKASSGMKTLAGHTNKAAESAMSLKGALAAVGGFALLSKGKSLLIDFNSEIDQMKIGMSTVMQMQMHMPFEKARKEADKLFETFQEIAKKSPATTKDFMKMAGFLSPAIALAGGGVEKLKKMTTGAVIASQALGEDPEMVGRDIQQMLAGTVGLKDRTALQLLGSKGIDKDKFNKMSGSERAKTTEDLLSQDSLKTAADQFGSNWQGQISTLKDTLEITLGQVGLPLMHAMTAEVSRWNDWIEKHPKLIKDWVTSFASTIKSGFDFLKDVASWFVEHKDLLEGLAKTFIAFKGAQMAGNVFNRFTTGVSGLADSLKNGIAALKSGGAEGGITGALGGFSGIASGLVSKVIPALGLFTGALELASHFLNQTAELEKKNQENAMSLNEATGDMPTMMARIKTLDAMLGSNSTIPELRVRAMQEKEGLEKKVMSPETVGMMLRKTSEASVKGGGLDLSTASMASLLNSNLIAKLPDTFNSKNVAENTKIMKDVEASLHIFQGFLTKDQQEQALKYAFPEQYGMPTPEETKAPSEDWKDLKDANVNVTIQKVEVASEDPDRFVFGLVQIADQATKHKTQSQHAVSGGF